MTHRLARILHVTDDDRRNTVPIVQPLVRSAKNFVKCHCFIQHKVYVAKNCVE